MKQTLQDLGWPSFCDIMLQTQQHERWLAWDGEVGASPGYGDPSGMPADAAVSAGAFRTSGNPNGLSW